MSAVVISVTNVSKCYRVFETQRSRLLHAINPSYTSGMSEVWALQDINLEVRKGESVALIGRNGSGKSTLLEIITGTLTPTSGTVEVVGRVAALLELGSGFNPEYTGRENVFLNGLLLGLGRADVERRFADIVAFADIGDVLDRPVKTYSSGMLVRLAFAVQVALEPDVLIVDEALSVGDFFFQQKCLARIRELQMAGTTILFVSHDTAAVRDLCQQAVYLKKSRVEFKGAAPEAIFRYFAERDMTEEETRSAKVKSTSTFGQFPGALWTSDTVDRGRIVAVFTRNKEGQSTTNFKIGETMEVLVLFRPVLHVPYHLTIGITNRFGQLMTATGSMQLGTEPFVASGGDELAAYTLKVELSLEAGNYSVEATLGYETGVNRGGRFDKTPHMGPVVISWNYDLNTAPFIGQCGLPAQGGFARYECA